MKKAIELNGDDAIVEVYYKKHSDCADVTRVNVTKKVKEIRVYSARYNEEGYSVGVKVDYYTREFIEKLYSAMKQHESGMVQVSKTDYNNGIDPYDELPF